MCADPHIPRRGPLPAPRAALRPSFLVAVEASPIPNWELSALAGNRHPQYLSRLLHMATVPLSAAPLLRKVALLVGYPPDRLFVDDADDAPSLTTCGAPATEAAAR